MRLAWRAAIFLLAFVSFACLLGTIYGLWPMRTFACVVYLPALAVLAGIVWRKRGDVTAQCIVQGAIAGLVAAVAYDLFRLPFVLHGAPLFKVFPRFGELLLGGTEPRWLVYALGWTYHFSNGAALGIMFLAVVTRPTRRTLFWGAVAWAVLIEVTLLLTNYATFFGIPFDRHFVVLTLSAHLVFGLTMGCWLRSRSQMLQQAPN